MISKGARYHIRELQSMALEKSPEKTMEKLEKISDEIWKRRKKLCA